MQKLILLFLLLITTSCAQLTKQFLKEPKIQIHSLQVKDITTADIGLNIVIEIENPNGIPLSTEQLRYQLFVSGEPLLEGVVERTIEVPARGSNRFEIPLRLKYSALGTLITNVVMKKTTEEFELIGDVKIGFFKVPYRKKGILTLK